MYLRIGIDSLTGFSYSLFLFMFVLGSMLCIGVYIKNIFKKKMYICNFIGTAPLLQGSAYFGTN